jgi:hypothetical protein
MKKTAAASAEGHQKVANNVLCAQTRAILKLWRANPAFQMRDTQIKDYEKLGKEFDGVSEKIDARIRELTILRKERNQLAARLAPLNLRARSGMRGYFGLHSPEFAQLKIGASVAA